MLGPHSFVYSNNVYYFTVGFFIMITDDFFSCIALHHSTCAIQTLMLQNAFLKGNFLDNNDVLDMSQFEVQLYFSFQ